MSYRINSLIVSDKIVPSSEKRLSICLEPNGFSFSITTTHDELYALGEVEMELAGGTSMSATMSSIKAAFDEAGIQPFGLQEAELVVMARQFVWVPQHLYDAANDRKYLEALCKLTAGYSVYSDLNEALQAQIIFSADSNLVSAFKIAIPGIKVRCQHSKMVNAPLMEQSAMRSLLVMNLREGAADYAVICNKKLQISNTYDCANVDEALYHAVNITKQFHLEEAALTLVVCGGVDRSSYEYMGRFFPSMALYSGRPLTLLCPEMSRQPLYRKALTLA